MSVLHIDEWPHELITPWSDKVETEKGIPYGANTFSYTLRLGTYVNMLVNGQKQEYWLRNHEAITLLPGQTMTASTEEQIDVPLDTVVWTACLDKLSSMGIQIIPKFMEGGYRGQLTLYIINSGMKPVNLYKGEGIIGLVCEKTSKKKEIAEKKNGSTSTVASDFSRQHGLREISRYDATSGIWNKTTDTD